MVYAKYCAPYPNQPCVVHEVNMWGLCCMMLSVLLNFPKSCDLSCDFAIRWLVWWHDQSTLTLVVLKIENGKINWKENKNKNKNKINQVQLSQSWQQNYNSPLKSIPWALYCLGCKFVLPYKQFHLVSKLIHLLFSVLDPLHVL